MSAVRSARHRRGINSTTITTERPEAARNSLVEALMTLNPCQAALPNSATQMTFVTILLNLLSRRPDLGKTQTIASNSKTTSNSTTLLMAHPSKGIRLAFIVFPT
jgi:hypothetical protein